jgi:tryptophan halogenase
MLHSKVNTVCIVGGGTAGWIAALSLRTYNPEINVTVVQPKDNKPIGVGESTQPDFLQLIQESPLDVVDLIKNTDATIKCGIYYRNWDTVGEDYWHPFTDMASKSSFTPAHYYQEMITQGEEGFSHETYYKDVHPSYTACVEQNKVYPDSAVALHVDAHKLSKYIQENLDGVTLYNSHEDMEVFFDDEEREITNIILDDETSISADLYIDATGFSQAIYGKIKHLGYYPYYYNVDTAHFAQVEYIDKEKECHPYTEAYAFEHGWMWTVPLTTRMGVGCVFAKNSEEEEDASLNAFIERWDGRIKKEDIRTVDFHSGQQVMPWMNNVVCVGLSAGFLEPLEATGISWIVQSTRLLNRLIADGQYDVETTELYNVLIREYVNQIIDFIDAHYSQSHRDDSHGWRFNSTRERPPRQNKKLEAYKKFMPNRKNRDPSLVWAFNEISWIDILNGYKFEYDKQYVADHVQEQAKKVFEETKKHIEEISKDNDYLSNIAYIKKVLTNGE